MPRLRNSMMQYFNDFNSIQRSPGTYVMRISPKSGSPVLGHTEVNSGHAIAISNSRPGRGLGNVSRTFVLDTPRDSSTLGRNRRVEARVSLTPTIARDSITAVLPQVSAA